MTSIPPRGAPWVSGLVGHFVQTWSDSECSHTVQFLDCSDLNWRCKHVDVPLNCDIINQSDHVTLKDNGRKERFWKGLMENIGEVRVAIAETWHWFCEVTFWRTQCELQWLETMAVWVTLYQQLWWLCNNGNGNFIIIVRPEVDIWWPAI